MGACFENYYHEFISCGCQPTAENCTFIQRAIKALDTENINPWVEVYAVHRGQVYWNGWGAMVVGVSGNGFIAEPNPRMVNSDYGVEFLPNLGDETGYLVRHVEPG